MQILGWASLNCLTVPVSLAFCCVVYALIVLTDVKSRNLAGLVRIGTEPEMIYFGPAERGDDAASLICFLVDCMFSRLKTPAC